MMKRISLKGVAIGNVVDILATNIVVLPVMVYILISSGPFDAGTASQILKASGVFKIWSSVLGALCSVLGGYVSARIAKHHEVLNGALSSILCVGAGVYAVLGGSAADDLGRHLAFLPLSPALAALGGYLCARRNAQQR